MTPESQLAGSKMWQVEYELFLTTTTNRLRELMEHPDFDNAEDLRDYVECMSTLLSFAPRAHPDIQRMVREGT